MNLAIFYFTGTGNTLYVARKLQVEFAQLEVACTLYDMSVVDDQTVADATKADFIIFAYPVQGSMAPLLVWQFVQKYEALWEGKKGAVVVTQFMFSGDGGAYLARVLRKKKMEIVSIEHFKMPNNLSDVKLFKVRNGTANKKVIAVTDQRIALFAMDFVKERHHRIGDHFTATFLGALQRVPYAKMERKLAKDVKIDIKKCNTCGVCTINCPTHNLMVEDGQITQKGICTICYRCVNLCPQKAISIVSKHKPTVQYHGVLDNRD